MEELLKVTIAAAVEAVRSAESAKFECGATQAACSLIDAAIKLQDVPVLLSEVRR